MSLFDTKATNWGDDEDEEKKDASKLSANAPTFSLVAPPPAAAAPTSFSFDAPKEPVRTATERTTSNQSSVGGITETLSKQAVSVVETVKTFWLRATRSSAAADGAAALVAARTWEELNLDPALLKGVYLANFAKPFKIQEAALPLILDGFKKTPVRENLLAQAKSGSGKTAAFALGMLQNVDLTKPHVQGMAMSYPELATQNAAVVQLIGKTLVEEKGLVVALALSEGSLRR